MDKYFFFSTLTVALLSIQYVRCDSIYNIIPTSDSPCPKGETCSTLQQYVDNPSFLSDTTLVLYPGTHHMTSQLHTFAVDSFTMRAAKTASVTVMCNQKLQPGNYYWFDFAQVLTVAISDITFNGCKVSLASLKGNNMNVTFVRSSFVNITYSCCSVLYISSTVSVVVKQCIFSDNNGQSAIIYSNGYNLTVDQSIFKNNSVAGFYYGGGAIYHTNGHVIILNSTFSNNQLGIATTLNGGAVYINAGKATIANSYFIGNLADGHGGAVAGISDQIIITNSYFINNTVRSNSSHGGALYASNLTIIDSYFSNNGAGSISGYGGAVYVTGGNTNVTGSNFGHNTAGGCGGAIAIDQTSNITVSDTTFMNNTANVGGGGVIYSVGRYTNISLLNNTFSNNTAAYCGVLDVDELYHASTNVVGNTFTYNRAVGQVSGSNGGGVICVRNASVSVLESTFSHNIAAGDAGVLQIDESDITVTNCTFSNNTAGSNGGVLYTYFYPTSYIINNSLFTNNQAGGDGGVMFVGRAGSQVKVTDSIFSYNSATGRGGVVAIAGSTLYTNGASLCEKNTAKLGRVASACKSKVTISNPKIPATPDPDYPDCSLYDCSNTT